jgi:hypothetical protein
MVGQPGDSLCTSVPPCFYCCPRYMALADTSPLYSVEIGHHVCDLVKVFNTQVRLLHSQHGGEVHM